MDQADKTFDSDLLNINLFFICSEEHTIDEDDRNDEMIEPLSTYETYTKPSDRICIGQKEEGLFFAEPEENFLSHTFVDKTERLK